MRRFLFIASAAAFAATIVVTAAPAATTPQFHVTLCPAAPVVPNPRPDGGGGLHQRDLQVTAEMDEGGCGGTNIGTISYSENFNLFPDGSSTAWCSFTADVTGYGSFDGHCAGDLNEGSLIGRGGSGSLLRGIYVLDESQAYELFFTITTR